MIQRENKKRAKPPLKKSKSLFHKENIALVFKKRKELFDSLMLLFTLKEQEEQKSEERKSKRANSQPYKKSLRCCLGERIDSIPNCSWILRKLYFLLGSYV